MRTQFVQADEIWTFCGCHERRLKPGAPAEWGDQYVWFALDSVAKMVLSFHVGRREGANAQAFIKDLSERVEGRFHLTTDGLRWYVPAVEYSVIPDSIARHDFWARQMHTIVGFFSTPLGRFGLGLLAALVIWADHRSVLKKSKGDRTLTIKRARYGVGGDQYVDVTTLLSAYIIRKQNKRARDQLDNVRRQKPILRRSKASCHWIFLSGK